MSYTRVSWCNVSELLGGIGYIPTTQNHIAMQGLKCFSDAVDGVAQKFQAFLQRFVILRKDTELVG